MKNLSKKTVVLLILFCIHLVSLQAQEKNPKIANDLNGLITKSSSYQKYKIIDKNAILDFQSSLNKYIENEANKQIDFKKQIGVNEKHISDLQKQIREIQIENNTLTNEKASISVLGFLISKNTYSILMWSLFLGTLLALVILFLKFKDVNSINKNSKAVLKDLEEEYESYRRVCIEREQGLRRQLFTEKKKNTELKNVS